MVAALKNSERRLFNASASYKTRVLTLALASRLLVLGLMLFSAVTFTDLDTSSHLQNFPCRDSQETGTPNATCQNLSLFDGFSPWDTVYFTRIAKCGYEADLFNAFFPVLPAAMRLAVRWTGIQWFFSCMPVESLYTLAGVAINLVAFCIAALALQCLTTTVLGNKRLANLSVVLFCFNPASVFYSAAYTESLFAAFTWMGLTFLENRRWMGVVMLGAASAVRSNGVLGAWFVVYPLISSVLQGRRPHLHAMLNTLMGCAAIFAPSFLMQGYGYFTYCVGVSSPEWCHRMFPSVYSHVQDKYWDVGFLRFYKELNRWPWLLQSAPVLWLSISSCWRWARADWQRAFSFGSISSPLATTRGRRISAKQRDQTVRTYAAAYTSDAVAPYIYHLAGMTAVTILVMHVNVATRFLSSSPVLYWFAALRLAERWAKTPDSQEGAWEYWLWVWFLGSTALGCLLFPNFYPFT